MNDINTDVWVNASDVGKAVYCPYSLYLSKQNISPNSEAIAKMAVGTEKHEAWKPEGANGFSRFIWFAFKCLFAVIGLGVAVWTFIGHYADLIGH